MTAWQKHERIGDCGLYLGDCLEVMPELGRFGEGWGILTDPPYGIGRDGQTKSNGVHGGRKAYELKGWDRERPSRAIFDVISRAQEGAIIWGGNYFADFLPPSMGWLVWDKGQRIKQSDGELAWTSRQSALRIFELNRVALMQDGAQHPTQKPVALMKWCLGFLPKAETILDPFMGSGTTGVACVQLGRKFTGIELDPDYFEIACRRIEAAVAEPRLDLGEPEPKPKQDALDL